jgi:3-oxoacyl-[acyl-carrier-protein] synthase III
MELDCLNFVAFDAPNNWRCVNNAEYLQRLQSTIWDSLSRRQQDLYVKLLASDRSRYVAIDMWNVECQGNYKKRYEQYKATLCKTIAECAHNLMEGQAARENVKLIITNQTVGGICPPPSSVVANTLHLESTECVDLGYMGCAAAIWAAELASRLLKPGEAAIIISAELTSVMTNFTGGDDCLPANCIFGDGAGAFLMIKPPHKYNSLFRIRDFSGSTITTTTALDCVKYESSDVYHEIRIKDTLPAVAMEGIKKALYPIVERNMISLHDKLLHTLMSRWPKWQQKVDYFVLHTAGNRVLRCVQEGLGLGIEQVKHNFEVFREFGNTSSASVYYALNALRNAGQLSKDKKLLFLAYGSGFMTKAMYATVN